MVNRTRARTYFEHQINDRVIDLKPIHDVVFGKWFIFESLVVFELFGERYRRSQKGTCFNCTVIKQTSRQVRGGGRERGREGVCAREGKKFQLDTVHESERVLEHLNAHLIPCQKIVQEESALFKSHLAQLASSRGLIVAGSRETKQLRKNHICHSSEDT